MPDQVTSHTLEELMDTLTAVRELPNPLVHLAVSACMPDRTVDPVNHPPHYNNHPSGVEAITVCEHMSFCLGNVIKYVWRADTKGNALEDLKKAAWYLEREIKRREKM